MSTRSVQVDGESLTLCLDCGALLYPSHASVHRDFHKQIEENTRQLKQLKSSAGG
jgi:hypothetical protein